MLVEVDASDSREVLVNGPAALLMAIVVNEF